LSLIYQPVINNKETECVSNIQGILTKSFLDLLFKVETKIESAKIYLLVFVSVGH